MLAAFEDHELSRLDEARTREPPLRVLFSDAPPDAAKYAP
jgi:hypothetical protein